jgi:hypothetical protein
VQSKKLDSIYSDLGENTISNFTKNHIYYTSIGLLTPALFILVMLAVYMYNTSDELTIRYDFYGMLIFTSIVCIYTITIISIITMIPSLFATDQSGLMSI